MKLREWLLLFPAGKGKVNRQSIAGCKSVPRLQFLFLTGHLFQFFPSCAQCIFSSPTGESPQNRIGKARPCTGRYPIASREKIRFAPQTSSFQRLPLSRKFVSNRPFKGFVNSTASHRGIRRRIGDVVLGAHPRTSPGISEMRRATNSCNMASAWSCGA